MTLQQMPLTIFAVWLMFSIAMRLMLVIEPSPHIPIFLLMVKIIWVVFTVGVWSIAFLRLFWPESNGIITGRDAESIRQEIAEGTPDTPERRAFMKEADRIYRVEKLATKAKSQKDDINGQK